MDSTAGILLSQQILDAVVTSFTRSGSATLQHFSERMLFLSFFISPGSAEALVR